MLMSHSFREGRRCPFFVLCSVVLLSLTCAFSEEIAEGVKLIPLTEDGQSRAVSWAYHGDKILFVRTMPGGEPKAVVRKKY
jgi:hypothetical protein